MKNKRPVGLIAPPLIIGFLATEHLLKMNHMASRMSYLVIICPNSFKKLTKNEIRSKWSWFEHGLKSFL